MKYFIWIVSPVGYTHSQCFAEAAISLHAAFVELGYGCEVVANPDCIDAPTIVLGANLLPHVRIPENVTLILFNLEQITEGSSWLTNDYINLLKRYEVWDYCRANVDALAAMGITARLCGIGYMPCLTKIEPDIEDIDVLHIGSLNPRREYILRLLQEKGVNVVHAFNCYGERRDKLIARAKICLNIHFYEAKQFEVVRCSYLMANKKFVISESGVGDEEFSDGVEFCEYGDLIETCEKYLLDGKLRKEKAERGFEIFSKMSQIDMVKRLL